MSCLKLPENLIRYTLGGLLSLMALNAFGGGYYGMSGAKGVPAEWLKGSLFHTYFVPGLILFVCVGGSAFLVAITVFRRNSAARTAAFFATAIVLLWLTVQIAIGYVSWMQPATGLTAILILLLTWQLPKYGH